MNKSDGTTARSGRLVPAAIITLLIFLVVAVAGAPLLAEDDVATAQDPDFGAVDDPLNGDYELYSVDDLLIMQTQPLNNETQSAVNNYVLETANQKISSQTERAVSTVDCFITTEKYSRQPQRTHIDRFFNLDYDVMVTLSPSSSASGDDCTGSDNLALHVQDVQTGDNIITTTGYNLSAENTAVAMEDFNLDGFEDLLILSNSGAVAATASDVDSKSSGMIFGSSTPFATADLAPAYEPTTGDFNDDGINDVAWIGQDATVHYASVCPGPLDGTICAGKAALDVLLDPLQSQATPITITFDCSNNPQALVGGNYTLDPGDGLVVLECIVNQGNGRSDIHAHWYQFESDWSLVGGKEVDSIRAAEVAIANHVLAQAGKLDWFGGTDQVVFAVGSNLFLSCDGEQTREDVGVITFSENAMTSFPITGKIGHCQNTNIGWPWLDGLAIGHFAAIPDSSTSPTAFNQQFATLLDDGSLRIYNVNAPASFQPSLLSQTTVNSSMGLIYKPKANPNDGDAQIDPFPFNWLVSGDLQGRSQKLGAPSIVRVSSHSQPSVILGAPPMHVDYILPVNTTSPDWDIINFTAVPDTYNSSYAMSETTSNQSADTNRTSYSYATSEMGGGSVSYKLPVVGSISASIKSVTQNKSESVSEQYAFQQNEFTYNASTTTGFGDEIWYDESTFNVYYYPVLGQTICPAGSSNCDPADEVPLNVAISGPSSSGTGPGAGASTEWYQPVHETGNIFSYPWNETLLAAQIPQGINLLSGPQSFSTDDSSQAQQLSWSKASGSSKSAGTTNTHSYDHSYSMTGAGIVFKVLGSSTPGNFSYNESTSISTLNKSSSSVGASQGVTIAKPGTFLDYSLYQYQVQPFIFGRKGSPNTVDTVLLPQDIQTTGPLQAAYAVNPLGSDEGSWWSGSPYASAIDVALNHPRRWSISNPTGTQTTLNCLAAGNRNDCLTFNDPDNTDLWNSEYHWMRGLFVTVNGLSGPQRTQATAGDIVNLEARVYNYSFMDMPSDSTIKVQFYRQEMNGTTPSGDSVLIAEQSAPPLPGFNSDSSPDTANWSTVSTTLDTTGLDDTYHIFWVLVWVEDGSGNLIKELQGHGLSGKPGTLPSIVQAPLEMVTLDGEQKTFSNNVGYLHSKFYIAPEGTQAAGPDVDPVLSIQNALATPEDAVPGEKVIISADITSDDAAADAVNVQFFPDANAWESYQADPSQPVPRAFDLEQIPHIDAGDTDRLEVPYRADSCGTQHVLIVAKAGAAGEVTTATADFSTGTCLVYNPIMANSSSN